MNDRTAIQHILIPHDFSQTADRAFTYALDLAAKVGARVTVVHAYEVASYGWAEGIALTADMVRELDRIAREALGKLVSRARERGIAADFEVRQGPPWMEILAVAEKSKVDLIVMGTHGRHGFSRMFLGSVAERVVRSAACPVLTVRGPGGEK